MTLTNSETEGEPTVKATATKEEELADGDATGLSEAAEESEGALDRDDLTPEPDDMELAEFKAQVRMYLEIDNVIKKLEVMCKDRRAYRDQISQRMVQFMTRFNIEDLDTPDGSIRSRVTYVRQPLTQRQIRQNIASYFAEVNPETGTHLTNAIFNGRDRVERVSLRRLPKKDEGRKVSV